MKKIYYLTRTFFPYQKNGASLMRNGAVDYLKDLDWNITVVMPNYNSNEFKIEGNIILIPLSYHIKTSLYLERLGFYEDYLDKWIKKAFEYLKNIITKDDIVFSTSGGELGMVKLGSLLKKEMDCKFVINFRDPINYGYMNGLRRDKKFHIGRVKAHEKYMKNADLILTSSKYYANTLSKKFSYLKDKIYNNYFGFVKLLDLSKYRKKESKKVKIAYAGIMSKTQSPELLYKAWKKLNDNNIEIYFIGDISQYKPLQGINEDSVYFIDFMPHNDFLEFMSENIDIGFVSLTNDYFGACVPSKIYEYINLGLPILGALPNGDGKDIINKNQYGVASDYKNINLLAKNIEKMKDKKSLKMFRDNILRDRELWFMKNTILEVDALLKRL